jgi:hypothetical protein
MLSAGAASANVIGIFADMEGTVCEADAMVAYSYVEVYFVALLSTVPTMSACEFGATGVSLPGTALPTVTWNTQLVIGDIMTPDGVALAFNPYLDGPVANLGSISYFVLAPFPMDHLMSIVPSGAGNLVVVDATDSSEVPAMGWGKIINCTLGDACACDVIATDETSWSEVKALY